MADGGQEGSKEHPHNLQGLLHMAIEAGEGENQVAANQMGQMTDERKLWLQEAMNSVFAGQADEVQQMKDCLQELSTDTSDEEGEERKEAALDLLSDLCENMDNASDFCKLGGMDLLLSCYVTSPEAELRWRTANLIGICSQNVPYVQDIVLQLDAITKLLQLLDHDGNNTVRIKALFAISCLVREQEAGLREFLKLDGFSVVMRAMQSNVEKLKIKSAFLLQSLLFSHPEHKDTLCSMGMIQQLISLLRTDHGPFHEHVLSALCSMVTDFPQGVLECQAPELAFEELLKERCQQIKQQEEFQEELEHCERLLKICFQDVADDAGMDR